MPNANQLRYDLLKLQYLDALEASDFETVAELWQQAVTDPVLESELISLSKGLLEEQGWNSPLTDDAQEVRRLLQQSFSQRPMPTEPGSITVSDVARQLRIDHQQGRIVLSEEELKHVDILQTQTALVPEKVSRSEVDAWVAEFNLPGDAHFWKVFRRAARGLNMRANQQATRMAAREEQPRSQQESNHDD